MKKLKPGHKWMMVRNSNNDKYTKRIVIDKFNKGVLAVNSIDQDDYFNNKLYHTTSWNYSKEIPILQPIKYENLSSLISKIVKAKNIKDKECLIIGREQESVKIGSQYFTAKELLNNFTYLNNDPICDESVL